MDIKRGESALQQLERGSVSLSELLQDMQSVSQKVSALDEIQKELINADNQLKDTIRHFDEKLLVALSPILQELSLRLKDTSDNLTGLKFEFVNQLTSLGTQMDRFEQVQLRTYGLHKWVLILLGVACTGSLGAFYLLAKPFIH
jgi:predicted transcriptional regulator